MDFGLLDLLGGGAAGVFLQYLHPAEMAIAGPPRRVDGEVPWVWGAYLSAIASLQAVKCLCRSSRAALADAEAPDPFLLARLCGFRELERRAARRLVSGSFALNDPTLGAFPGARWWVAPAPAIGGAVLEEAFQQLLHALVLLLSAETQRGSPRAMAAALFGRYGPADRWVSVAVSDLPSAWPVSLGPPPPAAVGGFRWPDGSLRALAVDGFVAFSRPPAVDGMVAVSLVRPPAVSRVVARPARSRSRSR
jgi:hypothetical protein